MTKAVIFDWGGVFMRTTDYSTRHKWDNELNMPYGAVERVVHGIPEWEQLQRGEIDNRAYEQAISRELDIALGVTSQILADFYKGDQLNTNLVDILKALSGMAEVRTGLLSNNIVELREEIHQLGLTPYFDSIVISAEIGVMKPAPEAYHAALEAVDLAPADCIFIDDSPKNVQGAERIGMHAILFTPESSVRATLNAWLGIKTL